VTAHHARAGVGFALPWAGTLQYHSSACTKFSFSHNVFNFGRCQHCFSKVCNNRSQNLSDVSLTDAVPTLLVGYQGPVGVTPGQSSLAAADSSVQRIMPTSGALGASPLDQAFSQALAAPNGNVVHVQVCVCCTHAHTLH
jgi:hypothetical protein